MKKIVINNIVKLFLIAGISFLQFYQLQLSSCSKPLYILTSMVYLVLNVGLVMSINLFLSLFVKMHKSVAITSVVFFVWSICNYYVQKFHGSPLYYSTIKNAGTALGVIQDGGYKFEINSIIILIVILEIVIVLLTSVLYFSTKAYYLEKKSKKQIFLNKMSKVLVVCVEIVALSLIISGKVSWVDPVKIGFMWDGQLQNKGFLCVGIKDFTNTVNPILTPDGYDYEKLDQFKETDLIEKRTEKKIMPDVIFILNETFCDLGYETDEDYIEELYNLQNAYTGTAISSMMGGGTNNSEYELLTSNSTYLLKSEAPFNYLNMEENTNNVVQYFGKLGYKSTGMHCGGFNSYSRNIAYPAIGFDDIYIGGTDGFKYYGKYGERVWLDSDNYKDLIEVYEENPDIPQFMYMLTYQNHGSYEQNDEAMDTVHVVDDYGNLTDDLNEYLTSIQMSTEAFVDLTEYFADAGRPVIICMVGDHAPSFVGELLNDAPLSEGEKAIEGRKVPFVLWSNYGVDFSGMPDLVSMTDLVPMVVECADLPMSVYYKIIRELQQELPVRTSYGTYIDKEGNMGEYNEESPYYDELTKYYYMEYNSIVGGEEYMNELFEPPVDIN